MKTTLKLFTLMLLLALLLLPTSAVSGPWIFQRFAGWTGHLR